MTLNFNVTGEKRKELVHAIQTLTGIKAEYAGLPTYAFHIGPYTVSKTGELTFDDSVDAKPLMNGLGALGFRAEEEPASFRIAYPRKLLSDEGIGRLEKLLAAKGDLIRPALDAENLNIQVEEEQVAFPWFSRQPQPDETAACIRFICALCRFAENEKWINAKPRETDNPKFDFRTFLLRLGFIGSEPEMKKDRKILLSRLEGNSAFKSGHKPVAAE